MNNYVGENQLIDKIKEIIYKLCPVKEPRVEFKEYDCIYETQELWISFNFYNDENGVVNTQVMINRIGDSTYRSSYILVNDEVSTDVIGNLIRFLVENFPYVNSLSVSEIGIKLNFGIGFEHYEIRGIGCSEVILSFDTHPELRSNFSVLFSNYLEYIMATFQEEISKNPKCIKEFRGYYDILKPKMVKSFSSFELQQFVNLLTDEEIRNLLLGMDNGRFFQLCDQLEKDNVVVAGKGYQLKKVPVRNECGGR